VLLRVLLRVVHGGGAGRGTQARALEQAEQRMAENAEQQALMMDSLRVSI
jgi:hypothetical protein